MNASYPNDDFLGHIVDTKLAPNLEADKEKLYCEQRAIANWLKNGDSNTNFFHKVSTEKRKRKRAEKLLDSNDNIYENTKIFCRLPLAILIPSFH